MKSSKRDRSPANTPASCRACPLRLRSRAEVLQLYARVVGGALAALAVVARATDAAKPQSFHSVRLPFSRDGPTRPRKIAADRGDDKFENGAEGRGTQHKDPTSHFDGATYCEPLMKRRFD